jgi:hypothetical protein
MSQMFIKKPYAEIMEVKGEPEEGTLRVYCMMYPNVYNLQIRARGPLGGRYSKGTPRNMIATIHVTVEEVEELLRQMKAYASGETSEFGTAAPTAPKIFDLIVPSDCGDFLPSATFLRGEKKGGKFSLKSYHGITPSSYKRALRAAEICRERLEAIARS